jgi:hypothetical protein
MDVAALLPTMIGADVESRFLYRRKLNLASASAIALTDQRLCPSFHVVLVTPDMCVEIVV